MVTVGLCAKDGAMPKKIYHKGGIGSSMQRHGRKELLPQKEKKISRNDFRGMVARIEHERWVATQRETALVAQKTEERRLSSKRID